MDRRTAPLTLGLIPATALIVKGTHAAPLPSLRELLGPNWVCTIMDNRASPEVGNTYENFLRFADDANKVMAESARDILAHEFDCIDPSADKAYVAFLKQGIDDIHQVDAGTLLRGGYDLRALVESQPLWRTFGAPTRVIFFFQKRPGTVGP